MRTNPTHFYCKHALVLLLCLFVSISTMQAVPAWSGWQTKSQPDGTKIVVRQLGDEFYHYWETEDGKLAIEQADGTFVVSDKPLPSPVQVSARRKASKMYQPQPRKAIGKITLAPKGLVILVEFPDVKFKDENNKQAFNDMLNKVGYDYDGATGSAHDYFYDQSNHTYEPVFDVFGPIEMPHELAYYGEQDNGPDGVYGTDDDGDHDMYMADFVMDAVFAAHDAGCNFSQYDSDNDGEVDIIYFFYAGKGQAAGGGTETIWPHNWNLTGALYNERTHCKTDCEYYVRIDEEYNIVKNLPILDGKIINNYVCSAELKYEGGRSGIGTLCHEFSHVLGLPDYYDTEYGKNNEFGLTPGEWSIMDRGSYNNEERTPPSYSIFDKYFMGWATPKHLAKNISQDVVMTTGYDDAYQISGGASLVPFSCTDTVYYIENRQNTGWDAYLPGHGMLVWQVVYDAESWSYNRLNNVAGKPRYTVKSSSGDFTLIGNSNFFNRDPFPGENDVHRFLPLQGCSFTSIRETDDGKITFSFNSGVVCRNVSATVTGCKSYKLSDDCVPENMDLVVTFEPENELYDISSLSVKVGGTELTQGTEYALSEDHRKLTVFAAAISAHSGDVTINAAWAKAFVTYKFSSTTENCTYPANGTARLGEELNLIVTPDNGYSLSVEEWCWTITSNTYTRLYMGVDFSYDRVTNTLKIFNVAGDLYIMPNAVLVDYWYADGELYKEGSCGSTIYTPSPKPGNCSNGREFMGWCTNPDYHHLTDAPTFIKSGDTKEEVSTSFYAVYAQHGMPKVIGSTKSFNASTTGYIPTEYAAEQNKIIDDNFYYFAQFSRDAGTKVLKFRGAEDANGAGFVYNEYRYNDENTKNIKLHSIAITYNIADAYRNISLKIGSTKNPTSGRTITPTIKGDVYTFDCTDGELCDFFVLTNGNHEAYVDKIDINLTPAAGYLNYSTKCDETPAYTVVFRDEDGTLLGEPMVVESGKAVTAPSVHKDCYDLSWDNDFSKVTADMTVTAVWTSQKKYDWTIESEDNNKGVVIFNPVPTCKDLTLNFRAEAKDGYQFVQWSDGVTDAQRTVTLTRDTTITAQFAKLWTITWKDEDSETVLYVSTVPDGQKPVYKDGVEVPTKEPDAQNIYKFLTWIPTLKKATENATYTAYYSSERRKYTVTFKDGDEVLDTQNVSYGSSATDPHPYKSCYDYSWDKEFNNVTEDMTVNIIWTPKALAYKYSATSEDESKGTVTYVQEPTCADRTFIVRADAKDGYAFLEWSDGKKQNPRTLYVYSDTEITAKWQKGWKITWLNFNDTILRVDRVADGATPNFGYPNPTRTDDAQHTYSFKKWNPTVVPATDNAVYKAEYYEWARKYDVRFQYEDGSEIVTRSVAYGKAAAEPNSTEMPIPDCKKAVYDKDFSNITGDLVVTISFEDIKIPSYTITSADESQGSVQILQEPSCNDLTLKFKANAKTGYEFKQWSDGNTDNPREITLTENIELQALWKEATYTVIFMDGDKMEKEEQVEYGSSATPPEIEIPDCKLLTWKPDYSNITGNLTVYAQWSDKPLGYTYEIHVSDKKMGSCTISKSPTCSSPTLTVRADANDGYRFVKWSDGATENPYTVTVDKNIELTAIFEEIEVEPVEVTGDKDITEIVTDASTEIEVTPEAHLTVSTPTTIHSITLEYNVDDNEKGHAQLSGITNLTVDEIEVKMQFPTPIGPLDEQWFAIAVPFAVSMATGIRYEGSDKPAIPGTDFIVEEYDGALRATTQRGWKSVKGDATLYPGHMYMISMASHATWYLKAADPKTLSEPTGIGISAYDSKIGAHHSGWNGIANTLFTCASGDAAGISYATTFNNKKGVYEAQATGSYVFGAAVPFFVQTAAGGVLNFTDESGTPAPLRAQYAQSSSIAAVTLSDGNYTDKAFWTVKADKQDVYTIGSDLQKMQVANAGVPQISILAYNMKLSAYEAPFDGTATIPVSLYAPAEGTYSIAVSNVPDDLNVLLMRNGNLVWDITSSPYAADLQAGDNSGYSLYVQRIKEMGTGVNNNGNETHNVQKVLFNDRIYIIRDGRTYVITGECVKE